MEDFEAEFLKIRSKLSSYLLRLTAHPQDAEDLCQETYIRIKQKVHTFASRSSFKTWAFTVATNLAKDHFRVRKRWPENAQDICRERTMNDEERKTRMLDFQKNSVTAAFELKEHIDMCFTCISKTLPLDQQVCLMLKDVYAFRMHEIVRITGLSLGVAKHALANARSTMEEVYQRRCSLVNKKGTCYQCTELNGIFNPKQKERLQTLPVPEKINGGDTRSLFQLRIKLVQSIDPFQAKGTNLHNYMLEILSKDQDQSQ